MDISEKDNNIEYLGEILFILDKIYKKGLRNNFFNNLIVVGDSLYHKLFPSYLSEDEFKEDLNWINEQTNGIVSFQERETFKYKFYKSDIHFQSGRARPPKPENEKEIQIFISDWDDFKKFYKKISLKINSVNKKNIVENDNFDDTLYITRNKKGDFFKDGELVKIPDKDTLYYIIFDTVFNLIPKGGFVSYEDIEKSLTKRKLKRINIPSLKKQKDRNKRISNNLLANKNGFFRHSSLENEIIGGRKLLETKRGMGVTFNNKK